MNGRILFLCVCHCALCLAGAAAFTPTEARRVYGESSLPSDAPFAEHGDYLFMNVKWKTDKENSSDENEAQNLSATLDALEGYVAPKRQDVTNSPFCKTLTDWMIPEDTFKFSDVDSVTVAEEHSGDERRAVVAFDLNALRRVRERTLASRKDFSAHGTADWAKELAGAYANFKTAKDRRRFFSLLGCPIVAFLDERIGFTAEEAVKNANGGEAELTELLNWNPPQDSVFREYPMLWWKSCREGASDGFFPRWTDTDGGLFAEAEKLYLKGKDVPKIVALLAGSIARNPIGAKKWEYLGGALRASNRHYEAVMAYMQSLRFDKGGVWAWRGLADSLRRSGKVVNADGLDWYIRMNGWAK